MTRRGRRSRGAARRGRRHAPRARDVSRAKLLTEAPVNGGPNYEGQPGRVQATASAAFAGREEGPHEIRLYAGNPVNPPLPWRQGNNGRGADNPQETFRTEGILRDCTPEDRATNGSPSPGWNVWFGQVAVPSVDPVLAPHGSKRQSDLRSDPDPAWRTPRLPKVAKFLVG